MLGNFWSGCSLGAKAAEMGGDSNTSSAIEYNSSWASTCAAEGMEVTEEEEEMQEKFKAVIISGQTSSVLRQ